MGIFASARLAPWTLDRMGKPTKTALREVVRDHPEKVEFYLIATPVSPGGLANLSQTIEAGIEEVTVRSSDLTKIIGVIVPRMVDGQPMGVVK